MAITIAGIIIYIYRKKKKGDIDKKIEDKNISFVNSSTTTYDQTQLKI